MKEKWLDVLRTLCTLLIIIVLEIPLTFGMIVLLIVMWIFKLFRNIYKALRCTLSKSGTLSKCFTIFDNIEKILF